MPYPDDPLPSSYFASLVDPSPLPVVDIRLATDWARSSPDALTRERKGFPRRKVQQYSCWLVGYNCVARWEAIALTLARRARNTV